MQRFEELQLMKFTWCQGIVDTATWNSSEIKQVDVEEYKDLFVADVEWAGHNLSSDEVDIEY